MTAQLDFMGVEEGLALVAVVDRLGAFGASAVVLIPLLPENTPRVFMIPVMMLAGIAAVAGHNWSVFLRFKGGAGTVTTVGVLAAMNVYVVAAVIVVGLIAMLISAPVGLMTAIYMSEYAKPGFRSVAKPLLEVLAGEIEFVGGGDLRLVRDVEAVHPVLYL